MADNFAENSPGLDSPAEHALVVTPNDLVDLAFTTRAIVIGAAGSLSVVMVGGETVNFPSVQPGILPLRVVRIRATGTSATGLVALW